MQNYKDPQNGVHVLDDTAFEHLLPSGCVPITQEEADALHPKPPNPIGDVNYNALIRRRADRLVAQGKQYDALILLKTIGA